MKQVRIDISSSEGETLAVVERTLKPLTFSTGSLGYREVFKIEFDGKRYQCSLQMVQIHSKPTA